jgi:hypothetical protein
MALEIHIITSREFFRVGAHGELDWPKSLQVLSLLAKTFTQRGTNLALLDVRDARGYLTADQMKALASTLKNSGFRPHHRVAILRRPQPERDITFVGEAANLGFAFRAFESYEQAADWLSSSGEKDPDFDREVYLGPSADSARKDTMPPPDDGT